MSNTLTIRNLDDAVKQKLRVQAARHQRSMEAEARHILKEGVSDPKKKLAPPATLEERRERIRSVSGIWKDRMKGKTTDDIMRELRSDD